MLTITMTETRIFKKFIYIKRVLLTNALRTLVKELKIESIYNGDHGQAKKK